ncbi:putative bifunctional diguanylate cyclase/phosphodiesterase [Cohnella xylanilytica]|uniref:putative bifunctional diguanylate cyclase/phosphodiesterase n=1 Tax=Cohnella xylanilytica TaxID=557555 RepID=UPI001BB401AC|nr:bifunctional diguanylate cyclase/phosphodiesterase [Cohnella xylanilytica]
MATMLSRHQVLLSVFGGFVLLQYALFPLISDRTVLILTIETLPYFFSFFALRRIARAHRNHHRLFWSLLSWGGLCYAFALLAWAVYDAALGIQAPTASVGDALWSLQSALYVSALAYLLAKESGVKRGIRFLFDTAIVVTVVGTIGWEFVIRPQLGSLLAAEGWRAVAATASYPVSDLAILCSLFMLYCDRCFPYPRSVFVPFVSGFIVYVVADAAYLFQVASDTYRIGGWVDPLYAAMVPFLVLAGSRSTTALPDGSRRPKDDAANPKLKYLLLYGGLIALLAFAVVQTDADSLNAVFLASMAILTLVVVRQVTVLLENDALMAKLQRTLRKTEALALYDPLSLLPNRRFFEKQASEDLEAANRAADGERSLAVLFLDLDRFKYVNDGFGHEAGDALLLEVAQRLTKLAGGRHFVARMGGDEFTMLCRGLGSERELRELAERVLGEIGRPYPFGPDGFRATASVGVAVYPKDGTTVASLLKSADIALYKAKSQGKNRAVFYSERFDRVLSLQMAMETELRKAIERDELVLHYQPQVDAASRKLVGVEALIRWQKQPGVMVSPAEFIPLAEETGLIVPIGEWVIRTACRQAKRWMDAGAPEFHMSVNVSPRQFSEANFVEVVSSVLDETGLPPDRLVLEITEGIAIQDVRETVEKLVALKRIGVLVSMDDFGTGYSSLAYLTLYQVDALKIAQTFISGVSADSDRASIVKAILAMASSLRLTVIAEGVETEEQYLFLKNHGCDWIQGYYFHKPLSAEEVSLLFAEAAA